MARRGRGRGDDGSLGLPAPGALFPGETRRPPRCALRADDTLARVRDAGGAAPPFLSRGRAPAARTALRLTRRRRALRRPRASVHPRPLASPGAPAPRLVVAARVAASPVAGVRLRRVRR